MRERWNWGDFVKVAAYTRVSTDGQLGDDRFGLAVQEQRIVDYCKANDMEIVDWFTDEGESGAKERPGFDEICYGDLPDVEAVVVAKSDRVARDINIYFYYKMLLTKKNIKLISVSEDFGIYGAFAPILEAFSMCVAQMERDNITMRTSAGRNAKARQGGFAGGAPPYGYTTSNRNLVVVESEKEIARHVFEMRSAGYTLQSICDTLNDSGYRTRSGHEWSDAAIRRILANQKLYEGYYRYKGNGERWVKGQHEPIMEKGEFNIDFDGRVYGNGAKAKSRKYAEEHKTVTASEISKVARDCKGMNDDYVRLKIKSEKPHFTESDIKMVLAMKN